VHRFKQAATNLAPVSAQPFVEGRRLHHTDFGDGTHSEAGSPVLAAQQNKLGPRYAARSCIGCHTNNGRALPPGSSVAGLNAQFYVNSAPWADLHYTINGGPQQSFRMAHDDGTNKNSHVVANIPGGAAVQYHYTIGNGSGGASNTAPAQFTMSGGSTGGNGTYGHLVLAPAMSYVVKVGQVSGKAVTPHPELGRVLQPQSASGSPEGNVSISSWTTTNGTFGDGAAYQLRRPNYTFTGPVPASYSARIAPQLVGLGLLEAVAESTISGLADPNDGNGDGVSGRMQLVDDPQSGQTRVGLFTSAGCAKCHAPTLTTSQHHPRAELRSQTIRPYTDMLLHDMGPGLSDNLPEDGASGAEWRTPPLWGIGLTADVSGGEAYLHDGRARSLAEAILWHGGEATAAKEAFRTMTLANRAALLKFLQSL
jgi:CxxC motif-containing protein (DUF1111 family)